MITSWLFWRKGHEHCHISEVVIERSDVVLPQEYIKFSVERGELKKDDLNFISSEC